MTAIVVTGTGTEVGKTIVTAAVAAVAHAAGQRVAVVKPVQTGTAAGEESDVETVARLSGVTDVHEFARYPEPLAPATAARRAGVVPLTTEAHAEQIRGLADRDLVLVEGAGGLLVRLDANGGTIADLAGRIGAAVLVVAAPGLGTLNSTALTCDAIRARGIGCLGVVIGDWPARPDLAMVANLADLPDYAGSPLLGAIPAGAGALGAIEFLSISRASLAPALGGVWSAPGA
jgi:dethiobiotin synthetase